MTNWISAAMLSLGEASGPAQRSLIVWMFQSLGPFYGLAIPLAGFAVFAGACLVVALSRRPAVIAAFLLFLPLPLLIGIFGTIHGFISSYSVIAMSPATPKPAEVAAGISTGLFTSLVGLLATLPAYVVLATGLLIRAIAWRKNTGQ